jgi:hypothetical protein
MGLDPCPFVKSNGRVKTAAGPVHEISAAWVAPPPPSPLLANPQWRSVDLNQAASLLPRDRNAVFCLLFGDLGTSKSHQSGVCLMSDMVSISH